MLRSVSGHTLSVCIALAIACAAQVSPAPPQFTDAVASRLLGQVVSGLQSNNAEQVLAAFDSAKMPNYHAFRSRIRAMFQNYQSFRAAYRLRQSWTEGPRGIVLVDFELEAVPFTPDTPPVRRAAQLRFEFEDRPQGWRIVQEAPRNFFP